MLNELFSFLALCIGAMIIVAGIILALGAGFALVELMGLGRGCG